MQMKEFFLSQLEREAVGTRAALARAPEGKNDWKPHAKSMPFGYLVGLVARMPSWVGMVIDLDEFVLDTAKDSAYNTVVATSTRDLLASFDESLAIGRKALQGTSDAHLEKNWKMLVHGRVVIDQPRYVALADSVIGHLAHHRGQLTVYLRLLEASVPAIYGPSADEGKF